MENTPGDVGLRQDYLSALKDIAALELHLQRTAAKCKSKELAHEYMQLLREIRKSRAKHQYRLVGEKTLVGETWCALKHSALVSKQLSEVGDKYLDTDREALALECYKDAQDFDAVFMLLLKLGEPSGNNKKPEEDDEESS